MTDDEPIRVEVHEQETEPATPPDVGPRLPPPMAITISTAEQQHQDEIRARSYRLAIERGHLRYN